MAAVDTMRRSRSPPQLALSTPSVPTTCLPIMMVASSSFISSVSWKKKIMMKIQKQRRSTPIIPNWSNPNNNNNNPNNNNGNHPQRGCGILTRTSIIHNTSMAKIMSVLVALYLLAVAIISSSVMFFPLPFLRFSIRRQPPLLCSTPSSSSSSSITVISATTTHHNAYDNHHHYHPDPALWTRRIEQSLSLSTLSQQNHHVHVRVFNATQQRAFVMKHMDECGGPRIQSVYDRLIQAGQNPFALEIFKYCALFVIGGGDSNSSNLPPQPQLHQTNYHNNKKENKKKNSRNEEDNNKDNDAVLFIDAASPLLVLLDDLLSRLASNQSMAVVGDATFFPHTMPSALLLLRKHHVHTIAHPMLQLFVSSSSSSFATRVSQNPLLVQQTLYQRVLGEIHNHNNNTDIINNDDGVQQEEEILRFGSSRDLFYLLEQTCHMNPLRRWTPSSRRNEETETTTALLKKDKEEENMVFRCPFNNELCCSTVDKPHNEVLMLSRDPTIPNQRLPSFSSSSNNASSSSSSMIKKPYQFEQHTLTLTTTHAARAREIVATDELPYISTLRAVTFEKPLHFNHNQSTPNLYQRFVDQNNLPSIECIRCLHLRKCVDYHKPCAQYLTDVCRRPPPHLSSPKKFMRKQVTVTPPQFRRDPNRLIPRIVHQTWFEPITHEKYPNFCRLVESWRNSGWEYKFYTDHDAKQFLKLHFPPEVLDAYDALIPGAFKADLFRYCALLIHGGVYADVDVLLEASQLDLAVGPDVGFMVPMDEPDACVWQGFIAAAPGHPFLVQAIQTVVNQVRNRFTSIDIDATFCPHPNWKVLHTFDVLFTAGPCLFGSSINRVLGRGGQEPFEPGDLRPAWETLPVDVHITHPTTMMMMMTTTTNNHQNRTQTQTQPPPPPQLRSMNPVIPGRTVILKQNKDDMGAHRFTQIDLNMIVAATDLENSDDRRNENEPEPEVPVPVSASVSSSSISTTTAKSSTKDTTTTATTTPLQQEKDRALVHYSKAHAKTEIYGVSGIYHDRIIADEDIIFKY